MLGGELGGCGALSQPILSEAVNPMGCLGGRPSSLPPQRPARAPWLINADTVQSPEG